MLDFNKWGTQSEPVDFEKVKAIALQNLQTILHRWQPGGKVNGHEYECGTLGGGEGSSTRTNMNTGVGSDFASGEKWGDPIDLVAQVERISMTEAAKVLSDFLGIDSATPLPPVIPIVPPEQKYEMGKREAMSMWLEAQDCPPTHPYLIKKGINPVGIIRYHEATRAILIPLQDEHQTLWSVQRIFEDGEKKVNHNGKMSGNFHVIPGDHDTVFICEGYATAATIATATGKTTYMAVSAGNLTAVGEKVSRLYPGARIVFAADNDQGGDKNPGIEAAQKAAKHIGRGAVLAPPFPEGQKGDWNDYAAAHGNTAVRQLLVHDGKRLFVDINDIQVSASEYLIDEVMETPCTAMVFGASGSGKSFFVLDLGLHIAAGMKWLSKETKHGPVVYVCGEGRHGIRRRITAWEHHHGIKVPRGRFFVSEQRLTFDQEGVDAVVADIDVQVEAIGQKPVLVIVDTLARALPGNADENSAKDTNLFFNNVDWIQHRYGCTALVVHHSGHGDQKRARGSSAIKGVLDVEILLSGGTIEWTKTKDMEPHLPIGYELKKVTYGDGRRDNSCVVVYDTNRQPREKKETAYHKVLVEALVKTVQAEGIGADRCTLEGVRNIFKDHYQGINPATVRSKFKRMLEKAEDDGILVADKHLIIVLDDGIKENIINAMTFGGRCTVA